MKLHILDNTGDTVLNWELGDKGAIRQAKKTFAEKTKQGYTAYVLGKKLDAFDPNAGSIILVPPVQGGYPQSG